MATSIKTLLNTRPNIDGRCTLILQIIHNRKRGVIASPFHLSDEQFDPRRGIAVALSRKKVDREFTATVNAYIKSQLGELWSVIQELDQSDKVYTARDITHSYRQRYDNHYVRAFFLSQIGILENNGKPGTASNYRATLAVFEKFIAGRRLHLDQMDEGLVVAFEHYLHQCGLQRNTITFYLRTLRSVYNKAKRQGYVRYGHAPFEAVSFREDKTRKLAVGADVLKQVAEADLGNCKELERARDLFMFSFYARGMSFVDMAYLKGEDIHGGNIRYRRHKTGQIFTVEIIPLLQAIIDRYADGCTPWVLPVMDGADIPNFPPGPRDYGASGASVSPENSIEQYQRYKKALARYLFYLKRVSTLLDLEEKLTFNMARHSWASLARRRNIPISVISEGLGHTSEKTTGIYLEELDAREVNRANAIVTKL